MPETVEIEIVNQSTIELEVVLPVVAESGSMAFDGVHDTIDSNVVTIIDSIL